MKKKIAIFTLPLRNYNYGGILQNYALQQFLLNNFDVEVETIDFKLHNKQKFRKRLKSYLHKKIYFRYYRFRKNINKSLEEFIVENIKISSTLKNVEGVENYINTKQHDVLLTGSDQVWRVDYAGPAYPLLFLNFSGKSNAKKISYAASFGFENWRFPEKTEEIKSGLDNFQAVSSREDSGLGILHDNFNIKGEHHIDPTLLLSKEDYITKFNLKEISKNRKVVYGYILDLDENKKNILQNAAMELDAELQIINLAENFLHTLNNHNYKKHRDYKADSIENWMKSFYEADYVITDSFHGTVFSILFEKPFIVLGNQKRGMSRFESLLKLLELDKHLIKDNDLNKIKDLLNQDINYSEIEKKLNIERNKSYQFLKEVIVE